MIHIAVNRKNLCGRGGLALTFRGIVMHVGLAEWLWKRFGCIECAEALEDALLTARPIR